MSRDGRAAIVSDDDGVKAGCEAKGRGWTTAVARAYIAKRAALYAHTAHHRRCKVLTVRGLRLTRRSARSRRSISSEYMNTEDARLTEI
jgi:hypothetical protein